MNTHFSRQSVAIGAVLLGLAAILGSLVNSNESAPMETVETQSEPTTSPPEAEPETSSNAAPKTVQESNQSRTEPKPTPQSTRPTRLIQLRDGTLVGENMPEDSGLQRVFSGELEKGQTVSKALVKMGRPLDTANAIVKALKGKYNFRRARPGAKFAFELDDNGRLKRFEFEHSRLEVYIVERDQTGRLKGRQALIEVREEITPLIGQVKSTLYQAIDDMGESPALATKLADAFAWDVDFNRDTRPGDSFRIVVEKFFVEDDFIRYGQVLAAEYQPVGETALRVYFFTPKGAKRGSYYLADGQNAEKIFLASPVKFSRISSGFDRKRKHPILGYTKAHLGVDYAAPKGTPVWAVASGKVTFAGWKGANGRLIRIDHGNGLVTAYAHLHRIRKGIKRGKKVKQKQIIGYVGSTGRSTGPHLHFGMRKKGRYVDPATVKVARMGPLPKRDRKRFDALVETMNTRLNEAAPSIPNP